jgi:hypothetical protein
MNPNSEDENTGRCILQANFCAAQIVERRETLRVIAEDPDESGVHECAVEGRAEVIVSGDCDKAFLPLGMPGTVADENKKIIPNRARWYNLTSDGSYRDTYLKNYTSTPPGIINFWLGGTSTIKSGMTWRFAKKLRKKPAWASSFRVKNPLLDRMDGRHHRRSHRGRGAGTAGAAQREMPPAVAVPSTPRLGVQNTTPVMGQHQKYVKDLEADGGHREKVDGDQLLGMILEKCAPSLRRWFAAAHQVFADAALTDVNAELQQLAVDPWRTPRRILSAHLADQISDHAGYDMSSPLALPHLPGPEKTKALAMPSDDRFGLDDGQRRAPIAPDTGEPDP